MQSVAPGGAIFVIPEHRSFSGKGLYIVCVWFFMEGVAHFFTYRENGKIIPDLEQMFCLGMIISCPFSVVKRVRRVVYFLWDIVLSQAVFVL